MKRTRFTGLLCLAVVLAACSKTSETALTGPEFARPLSQISTATSTDRHVFVMNNSIPASFGADVASSGGNVLYSFDNVGVVVTTGLSDQAAAALARGTAKVERDLLVQWLPQPGTEQHATIAMDAAPESHNPALAAFFASQWNMRKINAHLAWAAGAESNPSIRVAILDTGLDDRHIDQAGLIDMVNSIAFTPSVSVVPGPAWRDDHFHGTHVGGIVVANGFGVSGVAPHTTLIAVKVLDVNGSGTFSDIIAGIYHATNVGADVINMSLGGEFPKNADGGGQLVAALNRAINYAHQHDVVVVSSAGNENEDLQHNGNLIKVPCESGVGMCISATGPTDAKASYSNFGSSAISVASPGGENAAPLSQNFILSPCSTYSMQIAACQRPLPTSLFRYLYVIGTSQAAPHVSGLAALLRARGIEGASQVITKIEQTSDDLGKPGTDPIYGRGRINVLTAWTN